MAKFETDRNEANKNTGFVPGVAASTGKYLKDASSRPNLTFSSGRLSKGEIVIRLIEVIKAL